MSNRPSARASVPTPDLPVSTLNGPTHRVMCVRRSGGMWVFECADIPTDVWERHVIPSKSHGPDLFGMCAGQAEFEMHMAKERQ